MCEFILGPCGACWVRELSIKNIEKNILKHAPTDRDFCPWF